MDKLPAQIATLQWNNKLKSGLLSLSFLLGIVVFVTTLILMIALPISLVPGSGFNLNDLAHSDRLVSQFVKLFGKVLLFGIGATLFFIHRDISNIDKLFMARRLEMKTTDPFYRLLEGKCIERGLKTPEIYLFNRSTAPANMITAAVVQGTGGKSALLLTEAMLSLPPQQQEALAAQTAQRLYTKDTYFLTLFCFLGYFPFHVSRATNFIGRKIFWLPLKAADLAMKPLRATIFNLRMARLDAGSLELTKDAGAMVTFLQNLATLDDVEKYFYEPYLTLFIAKSGDDYRKRMLAA